jgi:hypothetical protein
MTEDKIDNITPEELEEVDGEPLPDREAMSVVPIGGPGDGFVVPGGGGEHTLPVEPPAES